MELEPEWVTGFVDGEGCFHVAIARHSGMRNGFQILPEFTVVQHERDVELLRTIRDFFGCGVVRTNHGTRWAFRVRDRRDLRKRIVPFFNEHPLRTCKRSDFELFRAVLEIMEKDGHLRAEGIETIRLLTSKMNRGRSR